MGPEIYIDILGDALLLVILLVSAIILPSLAVGLIVAVFQAAIQVLCSFLSSKEQLVTGTKVQLINYICK